VQGIEIASGIEVDLTINPADFDPDSDNDPDKPSRIEN
jgi:hypothetical protein